MRNNNLRNENNQGASFQSNRGYDSRNQNIHTSEKSEQLINVLAGQGISLLTLSEDPATLINNHQSIHQNQNQSSVSQGNWYTEIFSWGSDQAGQLGLGQSQIGKSYPVPRYCTYNIGIKYVSCGDEHAAFITTGNMVYSMGSNTNGQLGVGDMSLKMKNSPMLVEALMDQKPISIACGANHTLVCSERGDVYSWGQGIFGALGAGDLADQFLPKLIHISHDQLSTKSQMIQVSAGMRFSAILDQSGRVYTCGQNDAGQLGIGGRDQENIPISIKKFPERVSMIACGQMHLLMLTKQGTVYSCGANSFGQLGLNNKRNSSSPLLIQDISHIPMRFVAAGSFSASISYDSGDLYLWGSGVFGEFLTPHRVKTIKGMTVSVSIGNHFGIAVNQDGIVYSWGHNNSGELGQGDFDERPTPQIINQLNDKIVTLVSCGRNFSIALGQTLKQEAALCNQHEQLQSQNSYQNTSNTFQTHFNYNSNQNQAQNGSFIGQSYQSQPSHRLNNHQHQQQSKLNVSNIEQTESTFDLSKMTQKLKQQAKSAKSKKLKSSKQKLISNKSSLNISQQHSGHHAANSNLSFLLMQNQRNQKLKNQRDHSSSNNYTPLRSQSPMNRSKNFGTQIHCVACNINKSKDCKRCNKHLNNISENQISAQISQKRQQSQNKATASKFKNKRGSNSSNVNISDAVAEFQIQPHLIQQPIIHQPPTQIIVDNSQLIHQLDLNHQLKDELDHYRHQLQKLKQDQQNMEDQLWQEKQSKTQHESQIQDLRLQLQETSTQNQNLKSQVQSNQFDREKLETMEVRYTELERDYQRVKLHSQDLQGDNKQQMVKIQELESLLDKKRRELSSNEGLIVQYGENLKELELQFDRREEDIETLRKQNLQLKALIDDERQNNAGVKQIQIAYEEETKRRLQCEKELEKLRNEYYQGQANQSQEVENLRRALEDLRYQNEENLRILNLKDTEVLHSHKDIAQLRELLEKSNDEQENLQQIINELEVKNRKLNEKLSEVIYNKAAMYKERTQQALDRGDSPERKQRMQAHGINPHEVQKQIDPYIMQQQQQIPTQQSPQRSPDPVQNYRVYQELDKYETSNQKSPLLVKMHRDHQPSINVVQVTQEDDRNPRHLRDRQGKYQDNQRNQNQMSINELYAFNNGSSQNNNPHARNESAYTQHSSSPLRQKLNPMLYNNNTLRNQNNNQDQTPQRTQVSNSSYQNNPAIQYQQQYQDKLKNSCEKLASVLGMNNRDTHGNNGYNSVNQLNQPTFITGVNSSNSKGQHLLTNDDYLFNSNLSNNKNQRDISPLRQKDSTPSQQQAQQPYEQVYQPPKASSMTSSMIKKSLQDLRQKLDVMRKDKEAVENGINEFEHKNHHN